MSFVSPHTHIETLRLGHTDKVVDFGAGSGAYALAAAKAVSPLGVCYAIDLNSDLLRRLKNDALFAHVQNLEIITADIETHKGSKLPDSTMDAVLLCNTLFMLQNPRAALEEAYRILKKGGKLLIVDWSDTHGGVGPHLDHVVPEGKAKTLCEQAGFTITVLLPAGDYHYSFIAHKV